jgi:endonuclease/exonuclease/phosphatase family metal-dependent hydrolase
MNLRVLSYNIWGMPWGTKSIHEILMWILCCSGADVICLQEVFSMKHRKFIEEKCATAGWNCFFPHDPCYAGRVFSAYTSGSGLCILVRPNVQIRSVLPFVPYQACDSYVERLVSKGYFGVELEKDGKVLYVYNTHMIADFTECRPFRIVHTHTRRHQEKELFDALMKLDHPVILAGDFNSEEFHYFHRMYHDEDWTFHGTDEQIDHITCLPRDRKKLRAHDLCFYQTLEFSDHIPLRATIEFL